MREFHALCVKFTHGKPFSFGASAQSERLLINLELVMGEHSSVTALAGQPD
jgi:hypothetical protein